MATVVALSSEQQGISQDGSRGLTGIFTLTPGTTATAGEDITSKLDDYFQSIDSIEVCGCSAEAILHYKPVFQFTAGGLLSAHALTLFWLTVSGRTDWISIMALATSFPGKLIKPLQNRW